MRSLRILHVTPYYADAPGFGGIPRAVEALAAAQVARGHRVTVATTDACAPDRRADFTDRPEVKAFPNVSARLAFRLQLFLPRGLGAFLREKAGDFDVGHLHALHNVPVSLAARALRRARIPYLLQPHGTFARTERRRLAKRLFDAALGRGVVEGAWRVLAVSAFEERLLAFLGVSKAILRIVPAALPADLASPPAAKPTGTVVYLGQLSPRRQLPTLVEAVSRLPDARLVIAGPDAGALASVRAAARRCGVGNRLEIRGILAGRARLELLASASIAAYATANEVQGLVPLEALLCGTPVIVGDDAGAAEVLAQVGGGLAVKPGDVAALEAALREMLGNPAKWRESAREAPPKIRALYGAEAVAERLDDVLAEARAA